mmetsp:Transcript_990/g.1372  ORF Transcript_990/g.1372 Transcript_990/m.1372 type:complete len:107 (-) Transcript_990:522-842(-)
MQKGNTCTSHAIPSINDIYFKWLLFESQWYNLIIIQVLFQFSFYRISPCFRFTDISKVKTNLLTFDLVSDTYLASLSTPAYRGTFTAAAINVDSPNPYSKIESALK